MIMNMQVEGKTLTKLEMINHLMENLGMTRQDSRAFVENFFFRVVGDVDQRSPSQAIGVW